MRKYEIYDQETGGTIGTLLYYDREKTWIAELEEWLDEWSAPLLFSSFVKRGIYTIPRDVSLLWVKERVIPSDRQNISSILATHKLKEYDEMRLLELSEGICSQDSLAIRKIDKIPGHVEKRMRKNLTGMIPSDDKTLICFFADDTVKRVDLKKLSDIEGVEKIMRNEKLYATGKVGTGGYFLTFNDAYDFPAATLYKAGRSLPIRKQDFITFVQKNVLDTIEAGEELSCSRQNIAYMVKQDQLTPIRENVMGNLYLKEDVLKNKW